MAEPTSTSSAVAGIALATGAISITGSILGLQYDALLFGLFGGLISLMHLKPIGVMNLVGTLFTASVMGALFGPAAMAAAAASFDWFKAIPATPARLGGALLVGLFIQAVIPIALQFLAKRGPQAGGQS